MGYFVYGVNVKSDRRLGNIEEYSPVSFLYDREGKRKYLTAMERKAFLAAAQRMPADVRTFCLALTHTGARISEMLALTPERIDAVANLIILESLKKRRRGQFRAVPVPPALLIELERAHDLKAARRHPKRANRRIWNWCRTTAWNRVKACMRQAEVAGTRATPKGLRHGFAVGALQAGVPINLVRKWLGHARLSTTEIYADAVGEEEQEIASRFWKIL
jgi:integrase/recombinase XerD